MIALRAMPQHQVEDLTTMGAHINAMTRFLRMAFYDLPGKLVVPLILGKPYRQEPEKILDQLFQTRRICEQAS
jgi:hypothetical protein